MSFGHDSSFLHEAWFFGVRTGHKAMAETKMGQAGDPLAAARMIEEKAGGFEEALRRLEE
jgi:hypothetical protein